MELIDKVREILKTIEIDNSIVDIHYDEQKNIIGFLTSKSFETINEFEAQNMIWKSLKNKLSGEDLIKILGIFSETYSERDQRIGVNKTISFKPFSNKLWLHKAPGNTKYWVLIDVAKFGDIYKSFFLIVSSTEDLKKGLTFVYNKDVIKFMELENGEIYEELFTNAFDNSVAEIKSILMKKHDELSSAGLFGKNNRYNYVYEDFKLEPFPINKVIFNSKEIQFFKEALSKIDKYSATETILKQVNISEIILKNRQEL